MNFENDWLKDLQNSPIFQSLTTTFTEFDELLKKGIKDTGQRTIETKFGENKTFKTEIALTDADVKNDFPADVPKEDDVYWKRHNELVDNVLDMRKEIFLKSIEVAGTTIKGIVNPISVSPIDIAKLFENAAKK